MNVIHCQLWMGNLETYMTENFVIAAFRKMGEEPQTVRLMRNKYTGEPAGYCFVNFQTDDQAIDAMHKLNGKPIPGTNPVVRFRLNSASNSSKLPGNEREFSVWVGDLSADVDDYSLYRAFSTRYTSIKTAKVILDTSGFSKGYGFVRFGLEEEQKAALYEMNGWIGLGSKSLKICDAVPKPKGAPAAGGLSSGGGGGGADQYQDPAASWTAQSATATVAAAAGNVAAAWQSYDATGGAHQAAQQQQANYTAYYQQQVLQQQVESWQQQQQQQQSAAYQQYVQPQQQHYHHHQQQPQSHHHSQPHHNAAHHNHYEQQLDDEDLALVEYKYVLDADKLNQETNERDRNLYDALESSKWEYIEPLEIF